MAPQIRAITYARIITILKHYEKAADCTCTIEFRSDGSGSVINDTKKTLAVWTDINELNEVIKMVNQSTLTDKKEKYNKRYYRGR